MIQREELLQDCPCEALLLEGQEHGCQMEVVWEHQR